VELQISTRKSGDVAILDLRGRATIGVDCGRLSGHLKELVAKGERKLLLNLRDLTQMDSTGLEVIITTYLSLRRQGGALKFLHPCDHVLEVLRVLHLPDIIPSFDDETQALASFEPRSSFAKI